MISVAKLSISYRDLGAQPLACPPISATYGQWIELEGTPF